MAYHAPSKSRSIDRGKSQGPNLVPIMNLFLVIIPMLITMMVSVQMQMIAINLPTASGGGKGDKNSQEEKKEELADITLGIMPDKFQITVNNKMYKEIPNVDGKYQFATLDNVLSTLAKEHPDQKTIGIYPSGEVPFQYFIRTVDVCKLDGRYTGIKYVTSSRKVLVGK